MSSEIEQIRPLLKERRSEKSLRALQGPCSLVFCKPLEERFVRNEHMHMPVPIERYHPDISVE